MAMKGYYIAAHNHAKTVQEILNEVGWDAQQAQASKEFHNSGPHPNDVNDFVIWYPYRFNRYKKSGRWPDNSFTCEKSLRSWPH